MGRKEPVGKLSKHIIPYLIFLSIIVPLMGLTACGSGGGGGGNTGGGAEPVSIGPDGGTVTSEDGLASVTVPKGALSGEVVITIDPAPNPPAGNIGTAYEFGPAGMVFGEPVAIVIKYDEAALPSDIKVKEADLRLGKLVSNQWQLVSDSTVDTDADTVAGATTGFSIYGIIATEESINSLPLADAGADRTVMTGSTVSLDGSGSSDADDDPLTYIWTMTSRPEGSVAALSGDATETPSFTADRDGAYVITLVVNDGIADSAPDQVTITASTTAPPNTAPLAVDDDYSVDEDNTLNVDAAGVLTNDTDAENDPLTATLVNGPLNGVLTLHTDGSFTYTPDANFHGTDGFTYQASDGGLDSNTATVTITVNPVNDAPVAMDDEYSVDEDDSLIIDASSGVLVNDTDLEGDTLTALVLVATVDYGVLRLNEDGSFTYEPDGDFHGTDGFTYQAYDGAGYSNEAKVTIMVNPEVGAFYPSNGMDWNDYVKNDGIDRFEAMDTACDYLFGMEPGGYSACIHGGEMRSVEVPGYTGDNSCDGLTATDALGAFDWTCVVINSQATMVSTGLKSITALTGTTTGGLIDEAINQVIDASASFIADSVEAGDTVINTTQYTTTTVTSVDSEQLTLADPIFDLGDSYSINRDKNLSDLIDFSAPGWKSNSVTVKDGAVTLFTTPSTTWWMNPVVVDNDGGELLDAGVVYLVTAAPNNDYNLRASKIALVVEPGVTLTGSGVYGYVIYASGDFLWLEGRLDATGSYAGFNLEEVRFSVLRGVQADNGDYNLILDGAANNVLKNIIANNPIHADMTTGVYLVLSNYNTLENVIAAEDPDGVTLESSSNNTLTNIVAVNNSRFGIWVYNSSDNSLSDITAVDNNIGVYLLESSTNSLSNVTATMNKSNGITLWNSGNNVLSYITVADNMEPGLRLYGSSNNILLNVTASANAGPAGVYLTSASNNNSLSNVTADNNLTGVYLSTSANNSLSNVTANNNGNGVYVYASSDNSLSNVTTANNIFHGVNLFGNSRRNILSNVTSTNNRSSGVLLATSRDNTLLNVTSSNNSGNGVYLNISANNLLSNITAANNEGYGVQLSDSSENTLLNTVAAHNGGFGIYLQTGSSANYFTGNLKVENNNGDGSGRNCYVDAESTSGGLIDDIPGGVDDLHQGACIQAAPSDFGYNMSATLASSFVGAVTTDGSNSTAHTDGVANYDDITDWTHFDNLYRAWGKNANASPTDPANRGWSVSNESMRIWDWSLDVNDIVIRASLIKVLTGEATAARTHTWSTASSITYMINSVEIMDDDVGNDNGLCESGETCLYTPNIGSYQGHGALKSAGTFTTNGGGTITGVTLLEYDTNGY